MSTTTDTSNGADLIDSRDIIARLTELEADHDPESGELLDEDEAYELGALRELAEQGEGCPDWNYGETLIHEAHFKDYAQELAEDIGAVPTDGSWPTSYIDWERAANALLVDYTSLDYDGVTYYARA